MRIAEPNTIRIRIPRNQRVVRLLYMSRFHRWLLWQKNAPAGGQQGLQSLVPLVIKPLGPEFEIKSGGSLSTPSWYLFRLSPGLERQLEGELQRAHGHVRIQRLDQSSVAAAIDTSVALG